MNRFALSTAIQFIKISFNIRMLENIIKNNKTVLKTFIYIRILWITFTIYLIFLQMLPRKTHKQGLDTQIEESNFQGSLSSPLFNTKEKLNFKGGYLVIWGAAEVYNCLKLIKQRSIYLTTYVEVQGYCHCPKHVA